MLGFVTSQLLGRVAAYLGVAFLFFLLVLLLDALRGWSFFRRMRGWARKVHSHTSQLRNRPANEVREAQLLLSELGPFRVDSMDAYFQVLQKAVVMVPVVEAEAIGERAGAAVQAVISNSKNNTQAMKENLHELKLFLLKCIHGRLVLESDGCQVEKLGQGVPASAGGTTGVLTGGRENSSSVPGVNAPQQHVNQDDVVE